MTLEEKIAHLQETVMTEARSEGNAIIDNHKKALESLFEKHKKEATAQSEVRIKSETLRARRQVNQAAAKAETELKRALGQTQNELKVRLFDEVKELLSGKIREQTNIWTISAAKSAKPHALQMARR